MACEVGNPPTTISPCYLTVILAHMCKKYVMGPGYFRLHQLQTTETKELMSLINGIRNALVLAVPRCSCERRALLLASDSPLAHCPREDFRAEVNWENGALFVYPAATLGSQPHSDHSESNATQRIGGRSAGHTL